MILVFKAGYPVCDYKVEEFYQSQKHKDTVFVSSSLVVDRFRVAVKEGDISPFDIEVYEGEELYLLTVNSNGRINEDFPDSINIGSDLLDRLLF